MDAVTVSYQFDILSHRDSQMIRAPSISAVVPLEAAQDSWNTSGLCDSSVDHLEANSYQEKGGRCLDLKVKRGGFSLCVWKLSRWQRWKCLVPPRFFLESPRKITDLTSPEALKKVQPGVHLKVLVH